MKPSLVWKKRSVCLVGSYFQGATWACLRTRGLKRPRRRGILDGHEGVVSAKVRFSLRHRRWLW